MSDQTKFERLCKLSREVQYLESTNALLEWDQQTKLPKGGGEFRSEQVAFIAGEVHRRRTSIEYGDLLAELESSDLNSDSNSDMGSTISELKYEFDKKSKLPLELVERTARACSRGQQVWIKARSENDYSQFAPVVKEIFSLKRESADAIGYAEVPYDALLDDYEPGAKTSEVAAVLENLRKDLVPLVARIAESSHRPNIDIVRRNFPVDAQDKFCRHASSAIGFDYSRGRLDVTHHPFCTGLGPNDVRITTRFDKSFFNSAFFGTLHEAGHGIYEQGLRPDQFGLPPGRYCSLGIHESQSRLWENLVGRSKQFWKHFYPIAQTHFSEALTDVSLDEFYGAINDVRPSLIRVEADEATYNLHIIIRFQLEQEIINGELDSDDLPTAWNAKYQEFLGIEPPTDANGVMQDIHWSAGLIGYFPTYSLGNLYASQMYNAAENELGNLGELFATGEFASLKTWLNQNVHELGARFRSPELGQRVTGEALCHKPLIAHLTEKLSPIYEL